VAGWASKRLANTLWSAARLTTWNMPEIKGFVLASRYEYHWSATMPPPETCFGSVVAMRARLSRPCGRLTFNVV
jgi:hypothetical protein